MEIYSLKNKVMIGLLTKFAHIKKKLYLCKKLQI